MSFLTEHFLGTLVNFTVVLVTGILGAIIKRGVPKRVSDAVMSAMAICVIYIGIDGILEEAPAVSENSPLSAGLVKVLVMIVSMAIGTLIGELLGLESLVERLGAFIEKRIGAIGSGGGFAKGMVGCALLFCVGAMTVTGALESALMHTHDTYYAKGMIDMVCAVTFAATLGVGVVLSAAGVFAVQGTLVLIAVLAGSAIPAIVTGEMIAVGSLLVVAIGTNLLGVTKVKVMNLVPAMFFPIVLCPLYELIFV